MSKSGEPLKTTRSLQSLCRLRLLCVQPHGCSSPLILKLHLVACKFPCLVPLLGSCRSTGCLQHELASMGLAALVALFGKPDTCICLSSGTLASNFHWPPNCVDWDPIAWKPRDCEGGRVDLGPSCASGAQTRTRADVIQDQDRGLGRGLCLGPRKYVHCPC